MKPSGNLLRVGNLVGDLNSALSGVSVRVGDPNFARNLDRALADACASASARDLALRLASTGGAAIHLTSASDTVRDRDLARALHLEVDRILAHERDFARDLGRDLDLFVSISLGRELARDFARARDLALRLASALDSTSTSGRDSKARRVAPLAAGLLVAAARLLPAADRIRYAQEYQSELIELAWSGVGRWRQARYALSRIHGAPQMRFALRSPRRRGVTS